MPRREGRCVVFLSLDALPHRGHAHGRQRADRRFRTTHHERRIHANFPIPSSDCNVPATALAYSLNIGVVTPGPFAYLTVWPTGQPEPVVGTLSSPGAGIVSDAAIVPAGTGGAINIFVADTTDVIIDINGYFAP